MNVLRNAVRAVAMTVALAAASSAGARGDVEDYALDAFTPEERGKISPYGWSARRLVDEHGFFVALLSSAETVEHPKPNVWRITIPGYTAADTPNVCMAAIDPKRRPGMTMASIQARIGEVIAPGSPFEAYAAAEMDSIQSRTIEVMKSVAGKPGPRLGVWIGPRGGGFNAVGVLPAPAGTLLIGCTARTARDAQEQLIRSFKPAAGLL
ncbi:MAG: hypothetical protein Q8J89_01115 [Caulobacter sp.]|nr:hypothetical protein [Caulobacter sp.]